MTSVAISGAGGKLAEAIASAVTTADGLSLEALYNPNRGGTERNGLNVETDPHRIRVDVMVETAHPDHVFENLEVWRANELSTVIGTSGFTPQRLERLRALWGKSGPPCLVVPNFSIGAVLMMRYARAAARYFESVEVIERHHSTKPDAPSGTALATAMGIAEGGGVSSSNTAELVPGALGGSVEGVRIHSLRLPGLISQQEVAFSNEGEVFSIEHLSTSYQSFGSGALLAITKVGQLGSGVHLGLDKVLG